MQPCPLFTLASRDQCRLFPHTEICAAASPLIGSVWCQRCTAGEARAELPAQALVLRRALPIRLATCSRCRRQPPRHALFPRSLGWVFPAQGGAVSPGNAPCESLLASVEPPAPGQGLARARVSRRSELRLLDAGFPLALELKAPLWSCSPRQITHDCYCPVLQTLCLSHDLIILLQLINIERQ